MLKPSLKNKGWTNNTVMEKHARSLFLTRERIEATFWVAIGVVICVLAFKIDLGSFNEPGPGFVAFLTGIFLACMGVGIMVSGAVSKKRDNEPEIHSAFRFDSWRRVMYTMGLLLIYTIFLNQVGFILATLLMMFGLYFDWEKRNWFGSVLFAIVTTLISYTVFEIGLHCQLPQGLLPW
jgi:putative tricarboxylic transport membrane protein